MFSTRIPRRRIFAMLSIAALASAPAAMAQEGLPSAKDVYARYIEALGGEAALTQHTSSHITGSFSAPAQGIDGTLEIFSSAPMLLRVNIGIPGIGTVETGSDGTTFWTINPAVGPMIMEGTMLEQARQQADFYGQLHPERYVASSETVERTDFEGKPCYKLRVVTKWDEEYFELYDEATGLLAGTIRTQETPMGGVEAVTVYGDYRDFDGVTLPTQMIQRVMGMEQVMTTDSVEWDTVDPAVFALPDQIKALLEAQKPQ